MYEMNIDFNFQDRARPPLSQAVKTAMDYLQKESHHWSLVYCVLGLPFPLLCSVVSCNYFLNENTFYSEKSPQNMIRYLGTISKHI